jgi:hypothetical protein
VPQLTDKIEKTRLKIANFTLTPQYLGQMRCKTRLKMQKNTDLLDCMALDCKLWFWVERQGIGEKNL